MYVKLDYNGIRMPEDQNFYITGNKEKQEGLEKLGKAMASQDMAVAGFYSNLEENISVRPPFTRHTYERFRPGERIPEKDDDIMTSCRNAYQSVGVIRSVVDLITEHHLRQDNTDKITCFGAYILDLNTDKVEQHLAKVTLLATGGVGHVYKNTYMLMLFAYKLKQLSCLRMSINNVPQCFNTSNQFEAEHLNHV